MEPVVLLHGYSSEGPEPRRGAPTDREIAGIYGSLPEDLRRCFSPDVVTVNLSRYASLYDNVDLDDIALALDRALRSDFKDLMDGGFNVIVHSTGALVARNWIRRFWTERQTDGRRKACPMRRIVHLAGANFGSGWAHLGESELAKWGRLLFVGGTERGLAVLEGLELGSDFNLDLHTHFLVEGQDMLQDYGVMEFVVIGSQVTSTVAAQIPIRYGKEDGSDGVVRVSSGNLNFHYLRIAPVEGASVDWDKATQYAKDETKRLIQAGRSGELTARNAAAAKGTSVRNGDGEESGIDTAYYRPYADCRPKDAEPAPDGSPVRAKGVYTSVRHRIPFAIPYQTAHSDKKVGIVYGRDTREEVLDLICRALNCPLSDYESVAAYYDAATERTYDRVRDPDHAELFRRGFGRFIEAVRSLWRNPRGQYDRHAQVIVRVRDQNGKPVKNCSINFNSYRGDRTPDTLINTLVEDVHINNTVSGNVTYYLRLDAWEDGAGGWVSRVPQIHGIDLEVDSIDGATDRILFVPLRLKVSSEQLEAWLQPHRTTILDVELLRLPSDRTFILRGAGNAR